MITLSPDLVQHLTVFVIQLMEGNTALYKPCSALHGKALESAVLFICNGGKGHRGEFVYVRDEREGEEHFSLCEVMVFAALGK